MDAYTTDAWRKQRKAYLAGHPHCVDCGARATQPDHTPPRQLLVAAGVHDPDHTQWLNARCEPCHSRKTRTIDTPLLQRWRRGEDANQLCAEAMG